METVVAFLLGVAVATAYWARHYYRVSRLLDKSLVLTDRSIVNTEVALYRLPNPLGLRCFPGCPHTIDEPNCSRRGLA